MRLLDWLDRLDRSRVAAGWAGKLQPEDPRAVAIWEALSDEKRQEARVAAVRARMVEWDPKLALVVADLQLHAVSQLIRGVLLFLAVIAGLAVLLAIANVWRPLAPAFSGLAGLVLGCLVLALGLSRLDRARQENRRIAGQDDSD